jgi:hypothetical protein
MNQFSLKSGYLRLIGMNFRGVALKSAFDSKPIIPVLINCEIKTNWQSCIFVSLIVFSPILTTTNFIKEESKKLSITVAIVMQLKTIDF